MNDLINFGPDEGDQVSGLKIIHFQAPFLQLLFVLFFLMSLRGVPRPEKAVQQAETRPGAVARGHCARQFSPSLGEVVLPRHHLWSCYRPLPHPLVDASQRVDHCGPGRPVHLRR